MVGLSLLPQLMPARVARSGIIGKDGVRIGILARTADLYWKQIGPIGLFSGGNRKINSFTTTVEIDFAKIEEGTAVRLIEYGYEDSPEGVKNLIERASGWGQALTLLKFYVEYGLKY